MRTAVAAADEFLSRGNGSTTSDVSEKGNGRENRRNPAKKPNHTAVEDDNRSGTPIQRIHYALHVHKSGGTTLCKMARKNGESTRMTNNCNFPGDGPHTLGIVPSSASLSCQERYDRSIKEGITFSTFERFVAVHVGELDCPHLFVYMLVVRDPIERAESHVAVHGGKTARTDPLYRHVPLLDSDYARDNYLTRTLIGERGFSGEVPLGELTESHLEVAKGAIDKFEVVIRLSEFTLDAVQLRDVLGWEDVRPIRANGRRESKPRQEMAAFNSTGLREKNAIDLQLYRYACDRAEKLTGAAMHV